MIGFPKSQPPVALSVIVPTYNERTNIMALIPAVLDIVGSISSEIVVVDDSSPDGTAEEVEALRTSDPRIRLVSRATKSGLAGAVFTGVEAAQGEYVCIMDADFSHDPEEIPDMMAALKSGCDIVVGSRFAQGGSLGSQALGRRLVSIVTNLLVRTVLNLGPRDVLSGYVLCKRDALLGMPTRYSVNGFKFLLELLATRRDLRVCEWPIVFQNRAMGHSKASVQEGVELARLSARLIAWRLTDALRTR